MNEFINDRAFTNLLESNRQEQDRIISELKVICESTSKIGDGYAATDSILQNIRTAYSGADRKLANVMEHVQQLESKIKLDLLLTTSENTKRWMEEQTFTRLAATAKETQQQAVAGLMSRHFHKGKAAQVLKTDKGTLTRENMRSVKAFQEASAGDRKHMALVNAIQKNAMQEKIDSNY